MTPEQRRRNRKTGLLLAARYPSAEGLALDIAQGMLHHARAQGPPARKLNFFQTLKAILWGALGIRKGAGYSEDTRLNPVHVIVAGVIAAVLFVVTLVWVGSWAARSLTAT